ncbi:MAG: GGDEF domain-containing protein [Actinomycetota bacterium]
MRRSGRIATLFYLMGGVAAIPAILVVAPEDPLIYAIPLLGLVPAAVFMAVPWERVPSWVLHIPLAAGTAIICLVVTVVDLAFTAYYLFAAVFVAITFPRARPILAHMTLISAAMVFAIFVGQQTGRPAAIAVIVTVPTVVLVAWTVGWLTAGLEAGRAASLALSRTDELTGVGNYRALHERLEEETSRHDRRGRRLAVILVDLNDFKQVNEQRGHLEGDHMLAEVGRVLRMGVRAEDTVFRQGGDEFSVLAPETESKQAEDLATRLRIRLQALGGDNPPFGACTGVAIFPDDGTIGSDLLGIADVRLLAAKHQYRATAEVRENENGEA